MATPVLARPQLIAWIAIALAAGFVAWLLSPILAPFLAAALLAYMLNPLVDKLARARLPRALAALVVLALALAALAGLLLVVLPLFARELRSLLERLPGFLDWANEQLAPRLKSGLGIEFKLDLESVRQLAGEFFASGPDFAKQLLGSVKLGGYALLGFLVDVLIVPVVLFYLLRDWHRALEQLDRLIPRRVHAKAREILGQVDAVLAEFLRGQVLVMLVMSAYYASALSLTGLEFALPIGVITGLLVFIPYVGMLTGLALGTVGALMQFGSFTGVAWVWLAFGVGQALEGLAVTPYLVGERIGLHPVAVLFALFAFGQLFGFPGVLLALPASAALLVALRHVSRAYLASPLYGGPGE